jgi:hypothetical protein
MGKAWMVWATWAVLWCATVVTRGDWVTSLRSRGMSSVVVVRVVVSIRPGIRPGSRGVASVLVLKGLDLRQEVLPQWRVQLSGANQLVERRIS